MKKISITILICISFLTNSFAPLAAQESFTLRQRVAGMMPRPSLPSWAKGPGFEAAKKWWKAGRDTSVLDKKEKRAFNRLKKKFTIGAIIAAVAVAFGGRRWYQSRKRQAAPQAAPLDGAAQKGDLTEVNRLIAAGADVNAQNNDGETALMQAASNGHDDVVARLIAAGADLNAQDKYGHTALMQAASNGHDDVVARLIAAGADLNAQDMNGKTALMRATFWRHDAVVARLIAAGADLNAQNTYGNTAYDIADLRLK